MNHSFLIIETLKQAQSEIEKYLLPDSNISENECLNKLIEILDNDQLAKLMNKIEGKEVING